MKAVIDNTSSTWRALVEHIEARTDALRLQNDNPTLDATQTAVLRGRISELKNLLAVGNPLPAINADDGGPGY